MEFQYIVTTPAGTIEKGTLDAPSKEKALECLRQRKVSVISVSEKQEKTNLFLSSWARSFNIGSISTLDKVNFTRHLALMLRSGLSLVEALSTIQDQAVSSAMKKIINSVLKSVSNGKSLADSLSRFPKKFSGIIIGMVRVGEASGTLEKNLEYAANELEKDYELKRKIRSAMIYPTIVFSATVLVGIGLSIFILPRLVQLFNTFKIELPITTIIFLNIATFLVDFGWLVLIGLVGIFILLRILAKTKPTKLIFHRLYLNLPVVKKLSRNTNLARMTRVLAVLLKSGVTINESLMITIQVIDNELYKNELRAALDGIQKGNNIASVMTDKKFLPKMANRMISVGEKTGKLEDSLAYLAGFYEDEVDNATKNLASVVEPVLLIFIGVVLGFLAVSIISPIYQFTGSLNR